MKSPRRDVVLGLLGALLVGGGIVIGGLLFGDGGGSGTGSTGSLEATSTVPDDGGATGSTEPTVAAIRPSSTASSSSSSSTSPSSSSSSSSTSPSSSSSSSSPVDQDGPAISTVQSSETALWEDGTYVGCSSNPQTATVVVEASDPSGLSVVELEWTVNSYGWGTAMTRGADGGYWASLGPFHVDTLPSGSSMPLDVKVYARDGLGNETWFPLSALLWLNDCSDQDGPTIQSLQTTQSDLWENANYGGCPTQPQTAQVSAVVADDSGVRRVLLEWTINSKTWSASMVEIGTHAYSYEVGPFHEDTLALGGGTAAIYFRFIAEDTFGNVQMAEHPTGDLIILHDCSI